MKNFIFTLVFAFTVNAVNAQWQNINIPGGGAEKIAVKGDTVVASANYSQWIFYSKAHGDNWFIADNGIYLSELFTLAVSDSGIFAGGYNATTEWGELYRSTDLGASWQSVCSGCVGPSDFTTIATKDSFVFAGLDTYMGSGPGVLRSTDNFNTYTTVNNGLLNHNVGLLAMRDTEIFAKTSGGLFFSDDYGDHWVLKSASLTGITALSFMGDKVFAGTDSGVYISGDDGVNWTPADTGLINLQVTSLATSDSLLFAGTNGGGIFLSLDSGASWRAVNAGLSDSVATSLGVSGLYLFARTDSGVWRRQLNEFLISVEEMDAGDGGIIISPNPATSSFVITLNEQVRNAEAVIYDLVGKEVMRKALSGNRTEINTGGLPGGIYFVRVAGKERQWVKKIVVH